MAIHSESAQGCDITSHNVTNFIIFSVTQQEGLNQWSRHSLFVSFWYHIWRSSFLYCQRGRFFCCCCSSVCWWFFSKVLDAVWIYQSQSLEASFLQLFCKSLYPFSDFHIYSIVLLCVKWLARYYLLQIEVLIWPRVWESPPPMGCCCSLQIQMRKLQQNWHLRLPLLHLIVQALEKQLRIMVSRET